MPIARRQGVIFAGLCIGIVALGLFAASVPSGVTVFASGLLFAGASILCGGLIGLIFGVPRTVTGPSPRADDDAGLGSLVRKGLPTYNANTNLEQISDWLAKILVGLGLTQLGAIRAGASQLFTVMAPSLGGAPYSAAVAGGLVTYFAVLGFLVGWLLTRLSLAPAMAAADRAALAEILDEADRADARGDQQIAGALRQEARNVLIGSRSAAEAYLALRRAVGRGPSRTSAMEELVAQARKDGGARDYTRDQLRALFEGDDGDRIMALGRMQGDLDAADFRSAIEAIANSRSAFEQYQAIVLAEQLIPRLSELEKCELADNLRKQMTSGWIRADSNRWRAGQRVLLAIAQDK